MGCCGSTNEVMVLVEPSLPHLEGYVAALRQGWSPSNVRDVSGEHLAAPVGQLRDLVGDELRGTEVALWGCFLWA